MNIKPTSEQSNLEWLASLSTFDMNSMLAYISGYAPDAFRVGREQVQVWIDERNDHASRVTGEHNQMRPSNYDAE